jgi:hypothetical protein
MAMTNVSPAQDNDMTIVIDTTYVVTSVNNNTYIEEETYRKGTSRVIDPDTGDVESDLLLVNCNTAYGNAVYYITPRNDTEVELLESCLSNNSDNWGALVINEFSDATLVSLSDDMTENNSIHVYDNNDSDRLSIISILESDDRQIDFDLAGFKCHETLKNFYCEITVEEL